MGANSAESSRLAGGRQPGELEAPFLRYFQPQPSTTLRDSECDTTHLVLPRDSLAA
ncbi:MAG: hypothetical protein JWN52_6107 [Actinomycetia bacterium]|nr:hypothetical protein [Actinomycetes bacterium]